MRRIYVVPLCLGLLAADARAQPAKRACRPRRLPEGVLAEPRPGVQRARLDLDGDGQAEVLTVRTGGGSGMSTSTASVTLSADGARIEVTASFSFYSLVAENLVPRSLRRASRRPVREAIEDALFGTMCDRPGPSLRRLLRPQRRLQWQVGPPRWPATYTYRVPGRRWVWRTYLGANHARPMSAPPAFRVLDTKGRRALLGTAHGVVLADYARRRHTWLYVHPGGGKLRFPSIERAAFDGRRARIEWIARPTGERGAVTVNLRTGRTDKQRCAEDGCRP